MFSSNFSNQIAISTNRLLNIPYVFLYPIVCFMARVRRILQHAQFQFPPFTTSGIFAFEIDTILCGFFIAATLVCYENLSPINVISSSCWNRVLEEDPYLRPLFFFRSLLVIQLVRDLLEMCSIPRVICPFLVLYCE